MQTFDKPVICSFVSKYNDNMKSHIKFVLTMPCIAKQMSIDSLRGKIINIYYLHYCRYDSVLEIK